MIKLDNKNITYVALADSNNSLKAPKEIWYADSSNSVKLVYRRKDALIEGIDYEKYNLLNSYTDEGVTLPAQGADISVNPIPLDNKVLTIELGKISRNVSIWGKSPWFIPMWCMYVVNQYIMQLQERNGNGNTVHNITYSWNTSNIVTLDFQNKVARLGNNSFNIDGSNYKFDGFHSEMWQNPRTVGKIKISDELHLVPCKLLKPVPKWLDANGIRRQIGECGMIDLVSGKFYGNVNSVGTFTVENYYERKEWLQGRNGAYIDTRYVPIPSEDSFKFKINNNGFWKNPNNDDPHVFGTYSPRIRFGTFASSPENRYFFQYSNVVVGSAPYFTSPDYMQEVTLLNDGTKTKCIANGIENEYETTITEQFNNSIWLYAINNAPSKYFHGDIAYFKITDTSSNTKMNLIPCTLTMDLPASMDANNIARTKGTSGMWDLVSDRFYGNVANSGTFKAVNLAEGVDYEVHQWLIGDGSAYIRINNDFNFATDYVGITAKLNDNSILYRRFFGYYKSYTNYAVSYELMYRSDYATDELRKPFSTDIRYAINPSGEFSLITSPIVSATSVSATYNGSVKNFDVQLANEYLSYTSDRMMLYTTTDTSLTIACGVKSFFINRGADTKVSLVPCQLLHSIPASFDANGIARQAGECGMYDTVNDVFYGNVASSGSFSVSDDS